MKSLKETLEKKSKVKMQNHKSSVESLKGKRDVLATSFESIFNFCVIFDLLFNFPPVEEN